MRVFVTGATGFIGRTLVPRLQRDGHSVIAWVRTPDRARDLLGDTVELVHAESGAGAMVDALRRCNAIANFAGEPIAGHRWTAARRRLIDDSRVKLTESLVDAMAAAGGTAN